MKRPGLHTTATIGALALTVSLAGLLPATTTAGNASSAAPRARRPAPGTRPSAWRSVRSVGPEALRGLRVLPVRRHRSALDLRRGDPSGRPGQAQRHVRRAGPVRPREPAYAQPGAGRRRAHLRRGGPSGPRGHLRATGLHPRRRRQLLLARHEADDRGPGRGDPRGAGPAQPARAAPAGAAQPADGAGRRRARPGRTDLPGPRAPARGRAGAPVREPEDRPDRPAAHRSSTTTCAANVRIEVRYARWSRAGAGLRFPRTVALWSDGERLHRELRPAGTVVANPRLAAAAFRIPASVRRPAVRRPADLGRPEDLGVGHVLRQPRVHQGRRPDRDQPAADRTGRHPARRGRPTTRSWCDAPAGSSWSRVRCTTSAPRP